jgi:hypothetical protein
MKVRQPASPRARVRRAFLVAIALLLPAVVLFGLLWSQITTDTARTQRALDGVAHLQPTGALLAALADAEGAAARDEPVDSDAIRIAVADLDVADAARGESLGVATRWIDLRERATGLADVRPVGPGGAAQVAEVSVLAAEFADAVAVGSGALDDEGPFADLVTAGLPDVLGASARLVSAAAATRPEEPDTLGREIAAREQLAERVDAVDGMLRRAGDGTEPDQAFIARAGDYRAAAAAAAPPAPWPRQRLRSVTPSAPARSSRCWCGPPPSCTGPRSPSCPVGSTPDRPTSASSPPWPPSRASPPSPSPAGSSGPACPAGARAIRATGTGPTTRSTTFRPSPTSSWSTPARC